MATRKLNVLVYTGTGTTVESVRHCLFSLRRLLSPNYAVIPVTEAVLLREPWTSTCALLVVPGGADLGYCRALDGEGNLRIDGYVRRGGRYLGLCAGGYYGSQRCEFEVGNRQLEVVGTRELAFFPGTCRGGAFKGFAYHSETGARAARLRARGDAFGGTSGAAPRDFHSYCNGGGVFVDAHRMTSNGVEVLATYEDEIDVEDEGKAAVVYCKVGEGAAILTGPHPEFAAANLHTHRDVTGYEDLRQALAEDDAARVDFLKACLTKLELEVSQGSSIPSLSALHLSSIHHGEVAELLQSCADIITQDDAGKTIKDGNDTFRIMTPETRWSTTALEDAISDSTPAGLDLDAITKQIIPHEDAWPHVKETPYFNHSVFYSSLQEFREKERDAEDWGEMLMYAEVVTSTNTMLEKNPKLLSKLSTGFTFTATIQVAGRGRGSNVWVTPTGSLCMSTVINHPAHYAATRPIVFIQYLAAVAIVEAVQSYDRGYQNIPVKLKWPNDIYARDPSKPASPPSYVKIGGILSNITYSNGAYQIVLGIGINTTNSRPTTSLNALLPDHGGVQALAPFCIERLVARILTRLEVLYKDFCRHGFTRELEERYYAHWLHDGQKVTLEAEGGVRAVVRGITRDWGMLRAEELDYNDRPTGRVWALQSDENSFDFWKGLVKRKV